MNNWWQLEVQDIAKKLETNSENGISNQEAKKRLEKYGPNQLQEEKGRSPIMIFLEQFKDFIIWVLIGAALISGFMKEWIDAIVIIAIVFLNAIMGLVQEYRAEKSLAALKKLASPTSKVIRDGQHAVIPSSELVPGDIIELESGDNIPADNRIVWHTSNFSIQEASLTGESTPVMKTYHALEEKETSLADRANMAYMGTLAVSGRARAAVVETGMKTELGKIAGMIQSIKRELTPLQKKLDQFGKWIVYLCFGIVLVVFLLGVWRGGFNKENILEMFITAVSLAVAAIPEGLPAVVTIALALGVQRMVSRHALIRKLPSVETLGCATVICSDKTGTLTRNEMTVQSVFTNGALFKVTGTGYEPKGEFTLDGNTIDPNKYPDLNRSLLCGVLCNGAQLREDGGVFKIIGDPTEGALLTAAAKLNIKKEELEGKYTFIDEIPFDPERKKMTVIRKDGDKIVAFVKGAPDILLNDCVAILENGKSRKLNDKDKEKILNANNDLANQAMRVLAVSYRELAGESERYEAKLVEKDLVFAGLMAMIDPPREEVKEAIKKCEAAGIRTVMITGDHKNTAVAIARELGFFHNDSRALTGAELDKISDEELVNEVEHIAVYARVSPEHKLRIVRSWRKRGEVVAMTGDGINDAPAVKEANIGIAMGITGTDVTKEVSDMVITDDNFASIVAAVEEGRGIFDNIRKFINYLLSCNAGEILVMFIPSLLGWPIPLAAIHILWINLITDGLPALALGVDPIDPKIMNRPPRRPDEPVVTKHRAYFILSQGVFIAICSLVAFGIGLAIKGVNLGIGIIEATPEQRIFAQTMAFTALAYSELFRAFSSRSISVSIFKLGFFTNMKLVIAAGSSFVLQTLILTIPFLRGIFKVEAIGIYNWLIVIVIASFPFWASEITKMINSRRWSED